MFLVQCYEIKFTETDIVISIHNTKMFTFFCTYVNIFAMYEKFEVNNFFFVMELNMYNWNYKSFTILICGLDCFHFMQWCVLPWHAISINNSHWSWVWRKTAPGCGVSTWENEVNPLPQLPPGHPWARCSTSKPPWLGSLHRTKKSWNVRSRKM